MFSNAITIFSVNRIDVRVDPSWLIIAALITWTLSRNFFPQVIPDAPPIVHLSMAIIAMLGLFGSLLLHELAHSFVALRLGNSIKYITLFLFGGVAELEEGNSSARTRILVAAAGPAMSLCLAVAFQMLEQMAMQIGLTAPLVEILSYLAMVNLVLAVFNLLPAFPLDGGRILRAVLWARSGDMLKATRTATKTSAVLAYTLVTLGVLAALQGAVVAGLWQIIIGGFILFVARASYSQELTKQALAGRTVADLMTAEPSTVSPEMMLSELVDQVISRKHLTFIPVVEDDVLLGRIDLSVLSGIERENWSTTRVGDVFVGLNQCATIRADVPLENMFETIAKTGRRKFLVMSDHRLVGVITFADLAHHLVAYDKNIASSPVSETGPNRNKRSEK